MTKRTLALSLGLAVAAASGTAWAATPQPSRQPQITLQRYEHAIARSCEEGLPPAAHAFRLYRAAHKAAGPSAIPSPEAAYLECERTEAP